MVNPGGTGRGTSVLSASLAPSPPSRSFIDALPSALPLPKKYTRFTALPTGRAAVAFLPPPLFALLEGASAETREALRRDATATPLFFAMMIPSPVGPFLWPFLEGRQYRT